MNSSSCLALEMLGSEDQAIIGRQDFFAAITLLNCQVCGTSVRMVAARCRKQGFSQRAAALRNTANHPSALASTKPEGRMPMS